MMLMTASFVDESLLGNKKGNHSFPIIRKCDIINTIPSKNSKCVIIRISAYLKHFNNSAFVCSPSPTKRVACVSAIDEQIKINLLSKQFNTSK